VDQRFYIHADPAQLSLTSYASRFVQSGRQYTFILTPPTIQFEDKPLVVYVKWMKLCMPSSQRTEEKRGSR
jgi:hypothetical protein